MILKRKIWPRTGLITSYYLRTRAEAYSFFSICKQKNGRYIISPFCSLPLISISQFPPHNYPLKEASLPQNPTKHLIFRAVLASTLAIAMASKKFIATILIFSLLFLSTFSSACDPCHPKPKPKPSPPTAPTCPKDTLKLGVCADLLGPVNVVAGTPPYSKCCSLLEGLADMEAASCLCTAIKANVLGTNLNVPVALSAIVSACGKSIPPGFQCWWRMFLALARIIVSVLCSSL